ncbi:sulfotransferase family 2 domain-containing protein [Metabacillus elymi]|uniref:Sulfotransferase family 2 domain-containing protein n=1 Tax=Metabacillus elymi TaxID=2745198 RepID=A0ABX6S313_9BACI|nr:sulfotransferase family 2 domain-containing protein [Metabacillus sp. KUDC1714]QNF28464.1 sulfotransferase family 2 domain-containing protein [Metabacillus sp. KUDC1714]
MIISHKHKFIFIKTKKTAGTSIEISLSRFCSEEDIITPIYPTEDENIRAEFGKFPQNYVIEIHENNQIEKKEFYNHIPADEIKKLIGENIWNSYYKFCFERDPWDKVISAYYFIATKKSNEKITFEQFLDTYVTFPYNYPLYTIDDRVVVDFVGKYENLEEDIMKICKEIGLPYDGWLPKAKGNYRKNRDHYTKFYTLEQKQIVERYYKKEIELFDYRFGSGVI